MSIENEDGYDLDALTRQAINDAANGVSKRDRPEENAGDADEPGRVVVNKKYIDPLARRMAIIDLNHDGDETGIFLQAREDFNNPDAVIQYLEDAAARLITSSGCTIAQARLIEIGCIYNDGDEDPVIAEAMQRARDKEEMKRTIVEWVNRYLKQYEDSRVYTGDNIRINPSS